MIKKKESSVFLKLEELQKKVKTDCSPSYTKLMQDALEYYKEIYAFNNPDMTLSYYTEKDDIFALGQTIVAVMTQYGEYL